MKHHPPANAHPIPSLQPAAVCWAYPRGALQPLVAVSDRHSGAVHMYNGDRPTEGPVGKVSVHTSPVLALSYNVRFHCVVSADAKGVIDVWSADPAHGFGAPLPSAGLTYEFKSETDLYDVAKARAVPLSLAVAPTGLTFAVLASDHKVRLFRFRSGKLLRAYSEAPELAEQALRDGECGQRWRWNAWTVAGLALPGRIWCPYLSISLLPPMLSLSQAS